MGRGLRQDTPSVVGGVYLTDTGVNTGTYIVCEASWPDILEHNEMPGESRQSITGKVSNWSFPRGVAADGTATQRREIGRAITLILTGANKVLRDLLAAVMRLDTTFSFTLYHRFGTYTGTAKPNRNGPGPLVALGQDHHFVGDEAIDLQLRFITVSGAWS